MKNTKINTGGYSFGQLKHFGIYGPEDGYKDQKVFDLNMEDESKFFGDVPNFSHTPEETLAL